MTSQLQTSDVTAAGVDFPVFRYRRQSGDVSFVTLTEHSVALTMTMWTSDVGMGGRSLELSGASVWTKLKRDADTGHVGGQA